MSQVMSQATAPAFVLGAVAAFVAVLLNRMTSVIERIRSRNEIADGDTARAHSAFSSRSASPDLYWARNWIGDAVRSRFSPPPSNGR